MIKKIFIPLFLIGWVLMGCSFQEVIQEENDIENGKVFAIEQGCVQYSEGIQLFFAEYGKKQRIDISSYLITTTDSIPLMDISYIYRDSTLYMVCEELGYYYTVCPKDIFDLMAVRVEEFRLYGTYEITKTHLKPLGDVEVFQLLDKNSKHMVTSYGRVRMTESNFTTTIFDNRYESILHNLNVQHFYPTIREVTDKDPFDLTHLKPFDIWDIDEEEWTKNMELMYTLYLYYLYDNQI